MSDTQTKGSWVPINFCPSVKWKSLHSSLFNFLVEQKVDIFDSSGVMYSRAFLYKVCYIT